MIPKMLVLAGDARTNAVGPQKSTISVLNDMLSRFSWDFIGELKQRCFWAKDVNWKWGLFPFNPASPNGDQHQFSPNDIHTLSRDMVTRIDKMVTKVKLHWSFIKFSQHILYRNVWRSVWRICMWILGLKELIRHDDTKFVSEVSLFL